jgi:peptidoglycan/LPS O-acetylase OafA/YrhL
VWIGSISYGLFLWQQFFLNRQSHAWWCAFPQNLFLTISFATISYYIIERPILAFRDRNRQPERATVSEAIALNS